MNKRCDIIVAQWLVLIPCLISEQNSVAFNFCVMRSFRKFSTKVPKSGMNGKNFPLNDAQWKIFSKILHNGSRLGEFAEHKTSIELQILN